MNATPTSLLTIQSLPQTPIGTISLAASPRGLTHVWFGTPEALAAATGGQPGESPILSQALQQLAAYFSGALKQFSLPTDLTGRSEFARRVLQACAAIPYGETRTYAWLAAQSGRPAAARAAGGVMAANPLPIIIPCHRVVTAAGRLRGYSAPGGLETKSTLLSLEGIRVVNQRLA